MVTLNRITVKVKEIFMVLLIQTSLWMYQGGQGRAKAHLSSTVDKPFAVQTQRSLRVSDNAEKITGEEEDAFKEEKAKIKYREKRAGHSNYEEQDPDESGLHFLKTLQKLGIRQRTPRDLGFDSSDLLNVTCKPEKSCLGAGKCKEEKNPGYTDKALKCFCDKYCDFFQDCCADYTEACVKKTCISSSATPDVQWQCNEGGNQYYIRGVWMISSCPGNWTNNNITKNCIEPAPVAPDSYMYKDIVPVVDEKGNTYNNRFCALCHGVQANETQFYDVLQSCEDKFGFWLTEFNISTAMLTNCSYVTWIPRPGLPRRYCLQVKGSESCSLQSPILRELCSSSIPGIVQIDDQSGSEDMYLNKYCALCNNITQLKCGPPFTGFFLPLSTVFGEEDTNYMPDIIHCPDGQVFDIVSSECIQAIELLPLISFRKRQLIVIQCRFVACGSLEGRTIKSLKEALEGEFQLLFFQLLSIDVRHKGGLNYVAYLNVSFSSEIDLELINNSLTNSTIESRNVFFLVTKVTWKPIHCYDIRTYKPGEYEVSTSNASGVYVKSSGEKLHEVDYYTNQTEKKNGFSVPVGDIYVCRNQLRLNCSGTFIAVKERDYVILPNGFLYRNQSKMIHEFEMVNGTAVICVNYSSHYISQEHHEDDLALVVLTYVGLFLSIPCLLFVLVTYLLFKELRTLPGVNLMNLSLSLLLTHSLFIGTSATHVILICTVIAALLHYFYLVSFVWMSIIAFDTYRAFSRTCLHQQRAKKWRFIAIGWLPALVFVAICVSLDQSQVVDIGYGGSKSCWINNARSNLYFFVVPIACSVVFNIFFFIVTVHSIRKTKKQTQRVAAVSNRQSNFKLFLKLAILMGFTWIFGYLRLLVSHYFDYPFVIFNSLQGVYIAVAFVFTSRVKKMYGQLFGGTGGKISKSASVVTLESRL